jgi:hypothetical protein
MRMIESGDMEEKEEIKGMKLFGKGNAPREYSHRGW